MKNKKALLLTQGQLPRFCWLTVTYTMIQIALAFLALTGLGRTLSDGFVAGDQWILIGLLMVAAYCAFNETRHHDV